MIYITGDTHIPVDISKLNTKNFPSSKDMTKEDFLIICGDFGGVWDNSKEEKYWLKWLEQKNFTTLFIDGNHENFDMLNSFDEEELFGGKVHKVSEGIYHLIRGYVYEIDGWSFFAFGGASSHDIHLRTEGVNYWKEELPSEEEIKRAYDNLGKSGWNVDYVITHCAPTSVQKIISSGYEENILTDEFENISKRLGFEKWFFGHYHRDIDIDGRFIGVFDKIIKIDSKTK
ncbi:MAG: metallophosphoesterase [Eubacteriaceae bacterium]|nr:metallophosphoesterase [Eubacteriaceae bacterium]